MAKPSETTNVAGGQVDEERAELLGAVQALTDQVGDLRGELESLRAERRSLPASGSDAHGWEYRAPVGADRSQWVRNLDSPGARGPAVPRFALEILFLVAVAVVAAVARLEPAVIVGLLAAAWLLVAAFEWLAWRSAQRDEELLAGLSLREPQAVSDLAWFAPPIEHTAELPDDVAAPTAKLPPAQPE